jgi:hypothetical protein
MSRIWYNNLIDLSGVTITASSYASASLTGQNVTHDHKSKVWRTGTSTAAETLTFDLGSAKAVTSIIVFNHTLTASDSLIKIQGNASDSWGAPSINQALTHATTINQTFASGTYRYWRFIFTKSAAGESRDIGRIFLGTYEDIDDPDFDGLSPDPVDRTTKQRSIGGQVYSNVRSNYREVNVDFSGITTTQSGTVKTLSEYLGTGKSWFFQPLTSGTGEVAEIYYVKFKRLPQREGDGVHGSDGLPAWKFSFEIEEEL